MKRKLLCTLALTIALVAALPAAAGPTSGLLSPALEVISRDNGMVKTGLLYSGVRFSREDFADALGAEPSSITFTSLPPAADGALYLSSSPVSVNQTVSRANLDLLVFRPADGVRETSFTFSPDRTYTVECVVKLKAEANRTPVAGGATAAVMTTQRDVSCFGTLTGYDPDGDEIAFEVTRYPERGLFTMLDAGTGTFCYTPYEGIEGVDSFSYRVKDCFGGYSGEAKVTVKTVKRESEIVLADMVGHWGENAAISAVAQKAMSVVKRGGEYYFEPDGVMSREDFLVTVMKALGADGLSPARTAFADDADISSGASGYVAAAYRVGIIGGKKIDGETYFKPDEPVTRSEAAVIVNRIVGDRREASLPQTADRDAVPAWAADDVSALFASGVLNGAGGMIDPKGTVTRAEAAQIVYNVKNLYVS